MNAVNLHYTKIAPLSSAHCSTSSTAGLRQEAMT